ncbi:MAG: TIGR04053 family radical SAM/SPASM domain-containing protein [Polyangiaceae bacterium]|nr:TIGR04053 family radical SAM/SPASM domain-containing protein [Polyangiaceae bacterium]
MPWTTLTDVTRAGAPRAYPGRVTDAPAPTPLDRRGVNPFDHHPFLAIWELTQACDLVCAHCRASATPDRSSGELDTDEGRRLLDDIAAMGTPLVVLTGGDPAKRPDLVELVRHGAKAGLVMAVTPSGTSLTQRPLLEELKAAGLARLAVSVDGHDAATHDAFRGVAGSFDDSVRILETAREIGLETQVNTSLHGRNVGSLTEMAALVERVGAALWGVFALVPTGRASSSMLMGPRRLERILEQLADIAERAPFDVKTTAAPHFRRILMARHAKRASLGVLRDVDEHGVVQGARGITDGVGFLFVSHEGDVFPSGFLPLPAGNVRQTGVAEIYRDSPLFRSLRDLDQLGGKCGACPFKRVCGGSRARAFAMKGDALAEDPLCDYVPRGWVPAGEAAS